MKTDNRVKETCNKCKDCKYAKKVDQWNLVCTHEKWKDSIWGGTSCLMGRSRIACDDFDKR